MGTVAARHHQLVRLGGDQQAFGLEIGDDGLAGIVAVQAAIFLGAVLVDTRVEREDRDRRQAVAVADLPVVEVVRRRDLDAAGAEFLVDIGVGDDRNGATGERQDDVLAAAALLPQAEQIILFRSFLKSTGAEYTPLATFPLQKE